MANARQTLRQAIRLAHLPGTAISRAGLDGLPIGGWGETAQARDRLRDALPSRDLRDYTLTELIGALYDTSGDRYRRRTESEAYAATSEVAS